VQNKLNKIRIKFVDHCVANRFHDCIEINKKLTRYPKLFNYVLLHELNHTNKLFTLKDLKNDFKLMPRSILKEFFKFALENPKAFIQQSLPIIYLKDRGFVFDINLTIFYLSMVLAGIILYGG